MPRSAASKAPLLAAGALCDERYLVICPLSVGETVEVHKANDTRNRRLVALKILARSGEERGFPSTRTIVEERVLHETNHPGLVKVHACGLHQGRHPYHAMELLVGETLHEKIHGRPGQPARGRIPLAHALEWMIQLAEAVHHLHSVDLIHRNLTPENVFITNDGRVKGLDFAARKLARLGLPTPQLECRPATPHYMCPEHTRGLGRECPAWDVYALGFILYECLAGRYLFSEHTGQSHTNGELWSWHAHRARPSLRDSDPGYPPELDRILEKATSPAVAARFQTASAFMIALLGLRRILGERGLLDPLTPLVHHKAGEPLQIASLAPRESTPTPPPAQMPAVTVAPSETVTVAPSETVTPAETPTLAPTAIRTPARTPTPSWLIEAEIVEGDASGVENATAAAVPAPEVAHEAMLVAGARISLDPPHSQRRIRPDMRPAFARGLAAGMVVMLALVLATGLIARWRVRARDRAASASSPATSPPGEGDRPAPLPPLPPGASPTAAAEATAPSPLVAGSAAPGAPSTSTAAPLASTSKPPRNALVRPRGDPCSTLPIYCDLDDESHRPKPKAPTRLTPAKGTTGAPAPRPAAPP